MTNINVFETDLKRFVQCKKTPWRGRHDLEPTANITSDTVWDVRHGPAILDQVMSDTIWGVRHELVQNDQRAQCTPVQKD